MYYSAVAAVYEALSGVYTAHSGLAGQKYRVATLYLLSPAIQVSRAELPYTSIWAPGLSAPGGRTCAAGPFQTPTGARTGRPSQLPDVVGCL